MFDPYCVYKFKSMNVQNGQFKQDSSCKLYYRHVKKVVIT